MYIAELGLKNVGPFNQAALEFIDVESHDEKYKPPVVIITGENGSGKTIILDSIRQLFYGSYQSIERDILYRNDFAIESTLIQNGKSYLFTSYELAKNGGISTNMRELNTLFSKHARYEFKHDWIASYWTSKVSNDSFDLKNLITPPIEGHLRNSLSGIQSNIEVTALITYFDYLKNSEESDERDLGIYLFKILNEIIEASLYDGRLKHVSRRTLQPIIFQNGREVTLEKLSSGNLFLIQRLVSMIGKMYTAAVSNGMPLYRVLQMPGFLLIDEAENHLHPKWQKTFIQTVQHFFPRLQIILTTHSPFIVASIERSKVFVCKAEKGYSVVTDETDMYSNKPIDEILLTPVFNTQPFNENISNLIKQRKIAIEEGDSNNRAIIERKLIEINPEYFSYLDLKY